jgi:hypothetical protein
VVKSGKPFDAAIAMPKGLAFQDGI